MNLRSGLVQRWSALAGRERRVLTWGAMLVLLLLLWSVGIAPALDVLSRAPARMQMLDRQLQQMQQMAAQARQLQSRSVVRRAEALRTLEASLQRHFQDFAQTSISGDQVTVVLRSASPDALSRWLVQVRGSTRVVISQARLVRSTAGWDGSVVLQLPPA